MACILRLGKTIVRGRSFFWLFRTKTQGAFVEIPKNLFNWKYHLQSWKTNNIMRKEK